MFYVLKCILFLLASFLKCFLSFKLNFLYASGFPAKKPLRSLVSEFFDIIFNFQFCLCIPVCILCGGLY